MDWNKSATEAKIIFCTTTYKWLFQITSQNYIISSNTKRRKQIWPWYETLDSTGEMKLMKFYLCLHNFSELWHFIFSRSQGARKVELFTFKNGIWIARSKRHVTSKRDVSLCVRDSSTSSWSSSEILDKLAKIFDSESLDIFLTSEFLLDGKV